MKLWLHEGWTPVSWVNLLYWRVTLPLLQPFYIDFFCAFKVETLTGFFFSGQKPLEQMGKYVIHGAGIHHRNHYYK